MKRPIIQNIFWKCVQFAVHKYNVHAYMINIFMQVTFLVAGFMAMILMEWIGIKTVGPDAHSVMNTSSELTCTLNNYQPEWTLPMNFTCNKNNPDLNPLINGT